jgi:hypothetical protein
MTFTKTCLEPITGDNRRPGMDPDHKFLVRYNSHPRFGWLCCATFHNQELAEAFQQTKEAEAQDANHNV